MNYLPPRKVKAAKIPKVRKKPRRTSAIKCRAHLNWVKSTFDCLCKNDSCYGPIDPHHVISRGAGGDDTQVVPLCRHHHDAIHNMGVDTFEREYRKDLTATATALWETSPAGKAFRRAATTSIQVGTSAESECGDEAKPLQCLSAATPHQHTTGDE